MLRKIFMFAVGVIALFALLGVSTTAASQAPESSTTTQIIRKKIEWSLSPEQCSALTLAVNGTGQLHEVITTTTRADGSKRVFDNGFVQGTATDGMGGEYFFIYSNNWIRQFPAGGGTVQSRMIDTFLLTGNGDVNNLTEAFVWRWTYDPPDPEWPPSDNWLQIHTTGDPLHCDPL